MPFSTLKITLPLPEKRPFPAEIKTIGDHLKHFRLEKNLLINDVLEALNVDRDTYSGWERNRYEPLAKHYPDIVTFLGYYPPIHEIETLGGRIKMLRLRLGLNQEEFSKIVGAHRCTVRQWELNERLPAPQPPTETARNDQKYQPRQFMNSKYV